MSTDLLTPMTDAELEGASREDLLSEVRRGWRAAGFWRMQALAGFEVCRRYFAATGLGDDPAEYSRRHGLNEADTLAQRRIAGALARVAELEAEVARLRA